MREIKKVEICQTRKSPNSTFNYPEFRNRWPLSWVCCPPLMWPHQRVTSTGPLHEKKTVAPASGPAWRGGGWTLCAGGLRSIWELWGSLAFKNTCPAEPMLALSSPQGRVLTCGRLGKKGLEEMVCPSELGKLYVKKVRFLFLQDFWEPLLCCMLHCAVNHHRKLPEVIWSSYPLIRDYPALKLYLFMKRWLMKPNISIDNSLFCLLRAFV